LLLGIILAAGCGSGSGPAESQRVLHIWLDANQRELAFFGKAGSLIEAAHPGLRLRWKQVRLNDLKPVFLGHARQSREPDLVLLINDWVGELVRHGLLAEVPGSFPALLPPMLEAVTLEGRLYGVPWSFEALGGGR
jgi:maltose-binding protein MalE